MEVNGEALNLSEPVVTIDDKMYVGLRDFAEQADMEVVWDQKREKAMLFDKIPREEQETVLSYFEPDDMKELTVLDYKMEEFMYDEEEGRIGTQITAYVQTNQEGLKNNPGYFQTYPAYVDSQNLSGRLEILQEEYLPGNIFDAEKCKSKFLTPYFEEYYRGPFNKWVRSTFQYLIYVFYQPADDDPNIYNVLLYVIYPEQVPNPRQ